MMRCSTATIIPLGCFFFLRTVDSLSKVGKWPWYHNTVPSSHQTSVSVLITCVGLLPYRHLNLLTATTAIWWF